MSFRILFLSFIKLLKSFSLKLCFFDNDSIVLSTFFNCPASTLAFAVTLEPFIPASATSAAFVILTPALAKNPTCPAPTNASGISPSAVPV